MTFPVELLFSRIQPGLRFFMIVVVTVMGIHTFFQFCTVATYCVVPILSRYEFSIGKQYCANFEKHLNSCHRDDPYSKKYYYFTRSYLTNNENLLIELGPFRLNSQ